MYMDIILKWLRALMDIGFLFYFVIMNVISLFVCAFVVFTCVFGGVCVDSMELSWSVFVDCCCSIMSYVQYYSLSVPGSHVNFFTPYKVPIIQPKSGTNATMSQDAFGDLLCRVRVNGSPVLRWPQNINGTDYSPLPMFIKVPGQPLFDPSLNINGGYTLDRALVKNILSGVPVKGKGSDEVATWQRQHWSYYHMDPIFLALLARCAHELFYLYHVPGVDKSVYGVYLEVEGKHPDSKPELGRTLFGIWLPRTFVSYLVGLMLSDGSMQNTNSAKLYRADNIALKHGPSLLGFDLAMFCAAILELCGLGKGYVSLRDVYMRPTSVLSLRDSLSALTHSVVVESQSSRVVDALYDWFYVKRGSKNVKVVTDVAKQNFNLISLVFVILGDGGMKRRRSNLTFLVQDQEIDVRDRMYLHLSSFTAAELACVCDLLGDKFNVMSSVVNNNSYGNILLPSRSAATVSKLVHPYFPNSCTWKLHHSVTRLYDRHERFAYLEGSLAMHILNDLWTSGAIQSVEWLEQPLDAMFNLLEQRSCSLVDWSQLLIVKPMVTRSMWHSPAYVLHPLEHKEVIVGTYH